MQTSENLGTVSLLREKITNGEGWTGLLETGAWSGLRMRQGWSSFVYVTPWIISSHSCDRLWFNHNK